jgi:hypothetical protein
MSHAEKGCHASWAMGAMDARNDRILTPGKVCIALEIEDRSSAEDTFVQDLKNIE